MKCIKYKNRIISFICFSGILLSSVNITANAAIKNYSHIRLSGQNRYNTAIEIANNYCGSNTLDNVVLATGNDFPDALAGSVLASKLNAPILLVSKDMSINILSTDYIAKHLKKGGNIYILGGSGVVPDDLAKLLKDTGYNVIRYGGTNREETAKVIDESLNVSKGTPIVIATENDFPDALSISSVAGKNKYPILLSTKDSLPQYAKDYINKIQPSIIYVVGGEGVLSIGVINDIKSVTNAYSYNVTITRIGGINRFETSLNVAKAFNLSNTTNAIVATGNDFPDALTGSTIAVKNNAPILLVDNNDLTLLKQSIDNSNITNLTFLGGYGAVRSNTENTLINGSSSSTQPQQKVVYQPDIPIPPTLNYMLAHSVKAPAEYCVGNTLSSYKIPLDGKWYYSVEKFGDINMYDFGKILSDDVDSNGKTIRHTYDIEFTGDKLSVYGEGYTQPID